MEPVATPNISGDDLDEQPAELNVADPQCAMGSLRIQYNDRTPDLDRVTHVLRQTRANSSVGDENLLERLYAGSEEDTPESQRETLEGHAYRDIASSPSKVGPGQGVSSRVLIPASSLGSGGRRVERWETVEDAKRAMRAPGSSPTKYRRPGYTGASLYGPSTQVIESPVHVSAVGDQTTVADASASTDKVVLRFATIAGGPLLPPSRSSPPALSDDAMTTPKPDAECSPGRITLEPGLDAVYSDAETSTQLSDKADPADGYGCADDGGREFTIISAGSPQICKPRARHRITSSDEEDEYQHPDLSVSGSEISGATHAKKPKVHDDSSYLREDKRLLTRDDVINDTAVWCYSSNLTYYPAKLLVSYTNTPTSLVLFKEGEYEVNSEDLHYLDLRVGEQVIYNHKLYVVEALEKRNYHPIACVRGYDTVHLRQVLRSGKSTPGTICKPLMDIQLSLEQWARRHKIHLEENGSPNHTANTQELQRVSRRRRASKIVRHTSHRVEPSDGRVGHIDAGGSLPEDDNPAAPERTALEYAPPRQLPTVIAPGNQVFAKCLFVITGIERKYAAYMTELIHSQAGTVISSFSDNLDYIGNTLEWKKREYEDCIFACLIADQHLRTPRYLEALALGWPTLHWKFVIDCISKGRFSVEHSIFQFLLPAGESHRLSVDSRSKKGVVKSANISRFYNGLCNQCTLGHQLETYNVRQLKKFHVIILGHSDTDSFVEFVFSCFRVQKWEYAESISDILVLLKACQTRFDLLVYVNYADVQKSDRIKCDLVEMAANERALSDGPSEVHIETREWLVQTIINESCGWSKRTTVP
ncbi:AaceriAGR173Cp [[Ashbya] aceris (nom. inval.)]|nr:AaceriAGR173Cp [[Ashbya] aceris (nom. inval.)]